MDKAFDDNWFNNTHNLDITKDDLIKLLNVATKNQLFQFNGNSVRTDRRHRDGFTIRSARGKCVMCSVEEKLKRKNKLPSFYKRYVDDTLALVRDHSDATDLLTTLNEAHPSIQLTMEAATNNRLPFIGMEIIKIDHRLKEPVSTERRRIKDFFCTLRVMSTAGTNGHF